ncbi:MAG: type II secretion system ATPase GspE [Phycisphaerales bacterium]|nr:type II secretion system ATPase GspE [Phycisphaerales bacterium]
MSEAAKFIKMPPIDQLKGRPLGRVLIKMGRLTREQVHQGLDVQKEQRAKGVNTPIGQILVDMSMITEKDRNLALAAQMGYEMYDLAGRSIPKNVLEKVSAQMATSYRVVPVEYDAKAGQGGTLKVVLASPENFRAVDDLRTFLGMNVVAAIADPDDVNKFLARHYDARQETLSSLLSEITSDENLRALEGRGESIDLETLKDLAESNPVKRLLNMVLLQAIKEKASDVHFEPFEDEFKMRYRIDGVLYEMIPPPKHIAMAITSRIKVMANLDIAERRLPQDGRIPLVVEGKAVDLRVAVLPTIFGESVVMRILDRANVQLDLDKIGMREDDLRVFRQLINKPNGIVLVTGPTGSGKTTSLYAALNELNSIEDKLITTEDPVEYDIDGIIQVQIRPEIELTFASCLRSILRQDPDIVLVGEIRDKETAIIAVQASLTGHLVFSTLHTNDAPSSVARLLDLGIEPFLITATVEGIVAQRLVRRVCVQCKEEYVPTEEQLMELELLPEDVKGKTFWRGRGCDHCNNTGYRGRLGIYEIMLFDDEIRDMVMSHASTNLLREAARKRGMRTLRASGLLGIFEGLTTIEEVVKQTIVED